MWDLVGNPEDLFSHNEAKFFREESCVHYDNTPIHYTEIFTALKMSIFGYRIIIVFLFLLKPCSMGIFRVVTRTANTRFERI